MGEGSSSHEIAVAIIPKFGGMLSLIACTFIMRDVCIKWHRKKSVSLTSVIVFCISVVDWFYSFFAAFMSTWMVPDYYPGVYSASGTTQTCTAQGFVSALTIGASISFYTVLMILYWLMVHSGWTERHMSNLRLRSFFIIPPIVISLALAIPPLFMGMYNYSYSYSCFIAPYPPECEDNPEVDCIRGSGAWNYWDGFIVYAFICNMIIITFVILLVYTVFNQERKTDKYLIKGQEKRRENTTKVAWQGIRYIGAFMTAYLPSYVAYFYRCANKNPPLAILYLVVILMPLLGLFNSFVYFRPRYINYRENNPDESRLVCLGKVFNVELDYLENKREKLSKRLSSISGRSISGSILGASRKTGSGLSADNSSDGDLTSPLLQDNADSRDEERVV